MKTRYTLNLQRYAQEGDLQHTYAPLHNLVDSNGKITGFQVSDLNTDFEHPVNIECQPSYDGTVNLILTDDKNPPRIVNSRFTKIENNRFRVINRNQTQQSNLYDEDKVDLQTRLIKSTDKIPVISLLDVLSGGSLKGGCYTFYIKLVDEDQNETDFVAESGQVYIYKGSYEKISSISGTLVDETTDKIIKLKVQNVDRAFPKLFLYFTRATSDLNGIKQTKAYRVKTPYDINNATETITLNGFEELVELDESKLNIQYNIITKAKTEAQVQNIIFFGNIEQNNVLIDDLQALSYYIKVSVKQGDDIGWVSPDDYSIKDRLKLTQCEYYNPLNLYYKLGYWPNELYRLGVVYIMQDGSLSPVFNLRGRRFTGVDQSNFEYDTEKLRDNNGELIKLNKNKILNSPNWLDNTMGVFQNPDETVIDYKEKKVRPLYYEIELSTPVAEELKKLGVRGYFYVRQKRSPLTLCQAYSIGIDPGCYVPVLYDKTTGTPRYIAESFINKNKELVNGISNRIITTSSTNGSGLIAPEVTMIAELRSLFDGAEFGLFRATNNLCTKVSSQNDRHYFVENDSDTEFKTTDYGKNNLIYIGDGVNSKLLKGFIFSTQAGNAADISQFGLFNDKSNYSADNTNLVRGNYTPFVGVASNLPNGEIYNIMQRNYNEAYLENYMQIRGEDTAPFYAISDRFELDTKQNNTQDIYRGDCFTNTVTVRINRNFIDPEVPTNDIIVDKYTWRDNYKGLNYMKNNIDPNQLKDGYGDYININRGDVNTVPLGMWVTYKCLSNYNLGLRSIDTTNAAEMSLMGNARSFYPAEEMSTSSAAKVQDSTLLNQGLNSTLGARQNFIAPNLPYIKDQFDNRIMFSDVQTYGNFQNAYRIFKSLDYQDIERQYGAIVKLVPWNNNLVCVFEHGVGYVPVNEKALVSTQSGQSIHMYGAGVLQNQVTVINPDFGSIWQDSIIRTPVGLYGVDTTAKKIWRFSQQNGFETISDLKIQKFLNDNIKLNELDKTVKVALRNVKTHYNNFKGDVMFTFYNDNVAWNICYNERMSKWVTRYTWIPLCSENIDNIFYSFDRNDKMIQDSAKFADGQQLPVREGCAGLYVHGQAGIFDKSEGVEIKPTYWYDKQEKFEFEFVCNDEVGAHKIFNNLVIISNNAEPEKFEFIIDGDVYKENIQELDLKGDVILNGEVIDSKDYPNKKAIKIDEECKNIRKAGRRLGNTQYVEDSWYAQITPIKYEHDNKQKETRIRDKYVRIRVIYSGEDLAVITALKTIYTISYA